MKRQDIPVEQNTLDDPEWYRNLDVSTIPADTHDMHDANPAIRTLGGALDFLHGLEHDLSQWYQHEVREGRTPDDQLPEWLREKLPYRPNKVEVTSDPNPSASFHCQTFSIPAQTAQLQPILVSARADRVRAVLLNTGANPAFFSHQDDPNNSAPNNADMDWALVPTTFQRELRARGRIYVFSPLGTTVDIVEEYGYADRLKP